MRSVITILLALAACGEVKKSSTDVDAPPTVEADATTTSSDASPDAAPLVQRPGAVASTSGGGTVISSGHRARIRIGAPQPAGRSASATHNILTGPGALP